MSKRCDFMLDEESAEILKSVPKQLKSIYIREAIKCYREMCPEMAIMIGRLKRV